jgi:hypothetical protein
LDELKMGPVQSIDITIPMPGQPQAKPGATEKKQ